MTEKTYRIAFAFSGEAESAIAACDSFIETTADKYSLEPLFTKGLVYAPFGNIATIRKRKWNHSLHSMIAKHDDAEELGLYVFDSLTPVILPTFLANFHVTMTGRIAGIKLPFSSSFFVCSAVSEECLARVDAGAAYEKYFTEVYDNIGGLIGGILRGRPYVWNGSGGLEWMYRELSICLSDPACSVNPDVYLGSW
jgi:hypothetical protein